MKCEWNKHNCEILINKVFDLCENIHVIKQICQKSNISLECTSFEIFFFFSIAEKPSNMLTQKTLEKLLVILVN